MDTLIVRSEAKSQLGWQRLLAGTPTNLTEKGGKPCVTKIYTYVKYKNSHTIEIYSVTFESPHYSLRHAIQAHAR